MLYTPPPCPTNPPYGQITLRIENISSSDLFKTGDLRHAARWCGWCVMDLNVQLNRSGVAGHRLGETLAQKKAAIVSDRSSSDSPFINPERYPLMKIDPARGSTTKTYVFGFFEQILKSRPQQLLREKRSTFPEATLEFLPPLK